MEVSRHVDACRGSVLGAFLGDALGAPVELLPAETIQADPLFSSGVKAMHSQLELSSWAQQAVVLGMSIDELAAGNPTRPRGHYTDDTLMLLSLCEAIINAGGCCNADACAQALIKAWQYNEASDMRGLRGFGPGTQKAIEALADGSVTIHDSGFIEHPTGSNRNGGAMRIAPVGLLLSRSLASGSASISDLRMAVEAAIFATHRHPEGIDGAVAIAYGAAKFAAGGLHVDPALLLHELAAEVCMTPALRERFAFLAANWSPGNRAEFSWHDEAHTRDLHVLRESGVTFPGVGFTAVDGAIVATWMALRYKHDPSNALVRTVALGGDTDTLACMVGALVGAAHGWQEGQTFPADWIYALENGGRGKDFSLELATTLGTLSP